MFFASNWFYTCQFNEINQVQFNTRTHGLNGTLYWLGQILGAFTFGFALDSSYVRRTTRAKIAWGAMFVLTFAIWGGGYFLQKQYTCTDSEAKDYVLMDWNSNDYVGPMFLYILYGFYDAAWQMCVYW